MNEETSTAMETAFKEETFTATETAIKEDVHKMDTPSDDVQPLLDDPQEGDGKETHVSVMKQGDKTYYVVGTAHVSDASRKEVADLIEKLRPDTVCVELCQERYDSFKDENRWAKLDIFQVIKKGKFLFLLANLAVGAYQRRMGAKLGVKPGAELMGAVTLAEELGIPVALIDRNINTTLKRVWANLGFLTKCKLLAAIMDSVLISDTESKEVTSDEIENLKNDANLSSMMDLFAKEVPDVYTPLIDERDRFLCAKMREAEGNTVVAVVGAGHVNGIKKYFDQDIDTDAINVVPPPSVIWKIVKWLIPAIILGGLVYGGYSHGSEAFMELIKAWILPNSVFCFIGALVALARPWTILASIFVSPLTSTTPVIGAGIVLGLLEAWLRKPTVADCEDLVNVHTLKDFYKNPVTHILIVCVLTTIGSALGAWIGLAAIATILTHLGIA